MPKATKIQKPSSDLDPKSFSFKGMRHSLHIVLAALNYYFCGNSTTRKVSYALSMVHQAKVSHVTISKWIKRFAPVFQSIAKDHLLALNLADSDEWHFDERISKYQVKITIFGLL